MIEPALIAKRAKRAVNQLHRRDINNPRLERIVTAVELIEAQVAEIRREGAPKRAPFVPPENKGKQSYTLELPDDHRSLRGKRVTGEDEPAPKKRGRPPKKKSIGVEG